MYSGGVAGESIDQAKVEAIAGRLRHHAEAGGSASLGETRDLQPAAVEALRAQFGDVRVDKSRKVAAPHWPSAGHVDLVVRTPENPAENSILAELKWCGRKGDMIHEGVWDAFKMALMTRRPDRPRAYLLTGAPTLGSWISGRDSLPAAVLRRVRGGVGDEADAVDLSGVWVTGEAREELFVPA